MATQIPSYTGNVPDRENDGEETWAQNVYNLILWLATQFVSVFNTAVNEVESNRDLTQTYKNETNTIKSDTHIIKTEVEKMRDIVLDASNYMGDWVANYSTAENPNGYPTNCAVSFNDEIYYSKVADNQAQPTAGESDANWFYSGRKQIVHVTKTANYTALANDYVKLNASGGSFAVTLDNTIADDGEVFMLGLDVETNNVSVVDSTGANIVTTKGTYTSLTFNINNVEVKFKKSGNDWRVL